MTILRKKMPHTKSNNIHTTLEVDMVNALHARNYPSWIFDESTLKIIDANQLAADFCMYDSHELIGLSITELWHGEDLTDILNNIELYSGERSFYGNLKHTKKNGDVVTMRVRATRRLNPKTLWEVHLV
jgi:PAS domain S-box-containing protein